MSFSGLCTSSHTVFGMGEKVIWNHTCQQPPSNMSASWTQTAVNICERQQPTENDERLLNILWIRECDDAPFTSTGVKMTVLDVFYEDRKHKNSTRLITSLRASKIAQWVGMPDNHASPPEVLPQDARGDETQPPQLALWPHVYASAHLHTYTYTHLNKWKTFKLTSHIS